MKKHKKVLMLATTAAMSEQFNRENILLLEELGYEIHVAGNWYVGNPVSDQRLEQFKLWLGLHHGEWIHIPASRSPFNLKGNYQAYKQVVRLIEENKYEFIHCHTPVASVIGRLAAHFTKTRIIYTAHGFHFYKGAGLKNWLLYYPVEKLLSHWTDVLILLNKEDYSLARGSFFAESIMYVPGIGIDSRGLASMAFDRKGMREALGVESGDIMMLSVGELIPRKNHAAAIEAISRLGDPRIKYFICGRGELKKQLDDMIAEKGLKDQVYLLGFREDIGQLCHVADIFVFPSRQEGLSVALMEAMASGVVCIASRIRGNVDLLSRSRYLFDPGKVDELCLKIREAVQGIGVEEEITRNLERIRSCDRRVLNKIMKDVYRKMGDGAVFSESESTEKAGQRKDEKD